MVCPADSVKAPSAGGVVPAQKFIVIPHLCASSSCAAVLLLLTPPLHRRSPTPTPPLLRRARPRRLPQIRACSICADSTPRHPPLLLLRFRRPASAVGSSSAQRLPIAAVDSTLFPTSSAASPSPPTRPTRRRRLRPPASAVAAQRLPIAAAGPQPHSLPDELHSSTRPPIPPPAPLASAPKPRLHPFHLRNPRLHAPASTPRPPPLLLRCYRLHRPPPMLPTRIRLVFFLLRCFSALFLLHQFTTTLCIEIKE
ncbi:hypothetical protein DAI22_12g123450 [Oryza sativa Japonica Group]|nr:hypothetical protein DAI22_12g123450 [Oryza sativa Japonica Group]